jgi:hypothetical protein
MCTLCGTAPAPTRAPAAEDTYVTKLDPTGSALLYSTFIRETTDDFVYGLAVDSGGGAYVCGYATRLLARSRHSSVSQAGASNGFVTKLDASGFSLSYSTYLGGGTNDVAIEMAAESARNAYITGYTQSADFPLTAGAF